MDNLIAYCGIDCSQCPAFIAYKNDDDELREKTSKKWSEMYKIKYQQSISLIDKIDNQKPDDSSQDYKNFVYELKKEDINCEGCKAGKVHVYYCSSICNIRRCASSKNIENCAFCLDYPCQMLSDFIKDLVKAQDNLKKFLQK